jgi:predicted phosphatase
MKEVFGRMSKQNLVIFDLDGTLVHSDGRVEDFSVLDKLADEMNILAIASRNDYYHVIEVLEEQKIIHNFRYIMADFRPKVFQIREIMKLALEDSIEISQIVFIDDFLPNLQRVGDDEPSVTTFQFGVQINSLHEFYDELKKLN